MTRPKSKRQKTVEVFVDYWQDGKWGGWIRHTKCKPHVVHSSPENVCDAVREFLAMHGQTPNFCLSEGVQLLHQVIARTI